MQKLKQATGASDGPYNLLVEFFAVWLWFKIATFFRTAALRRVFDNRFSYKHCYFSLGFLPDKIAFKTVV